jgi:hypothetical protein
MSPAASHRQQRKTYCCGRHRGPLPLGTNKAIRHTPRGHISQQVQRNMMMLLVQELCLVSWFAEHESVVPETHTHAKHDIQESRGSSVSIVTELLTTRPSFVFRQLQGFFPPSPPRQDRLWGPPTFLSNGYRGLDPPGVKRPGREATSCLEVKNTCSYTSTPQ